MAPLRGFWGLRDVQERELLRSIVYIDTSQSDVPTSFHSLYTKKADFAVGFVGVEGFEPPTLCL